MQILQFAIKQQAFLSVLGLAKLQKEKMKTSHPSDEWDESSL